MKQTTWPCLVVLVAMLVSGIRADDIDLSFRPVEELVYSYSIDTRFRQDDPPSPLVLRSVAWKNDSLFDYIFERIMPGEPPNDVGVFRKDIFSRAGNEGFWNGIDLPPDAFFNIEVLSQIPIIFPYFPNGRYKPGQKWETEFPVPILYNYDTTSSESITSSKPIILKQSFHGFEKVLGYECAVIEYGMKDSIVTDFGEKMIFKCSGTAHFAYKWGGLVSDLLRVEHDVVRTKGENRKYHATRKIRMVDEGPSLKK